MLLWCLCTEGVWGLNTLIISDCCWLMMVESHKSWWKHRWSMVAQAPWLSQHPLPGFHPLKIPKMVHRPHAQAQAGAIRGPYEQQLMIQSYRMHVVWLCNVRSQKTEASVTASQLSYRLRMTDLQYPHCGRTSLSWGSNRSKRMTSLRKSLS